MDALMSCGGCLNKTPAPKFDEAAAGGNNFDGFLFLLAIYSNWPSRIEFDSDVW